MMSKEESLFQLQILAGIGLYCVPILVFMIGFAWRQGSRGLKIFENAPEYLFPILALWPATIAYFVATAPVFIVHKIAMWCRVRAEKKAKIGSFGEKYFDRKDT